MSFSVHQENNYYCRIFFRQPHQPTLFHTFFCLFIYFHLCVFVFVLLIYPLEREQYSWSRHRKYPQRYFICYYSFARVLSLIGQRSLFSPLRHNNYSLSFLCLFFCFCTAVLSCFTDNFGLFSMICRCHRYHWLFSLLFFIFLFFLYHIHALFVLCSLFLIFPSLVFLLLLFFFHRSDFSTSFLNHIHLVISTKTILLGVFPCLPPDSSSSSPFSVLDVLLSLTHPLRRI